MTRLLRIAPALFAFGSLVPQHAVAAAWTSPKGHGQILFSTSYFQATRSFDTSGTLQRFGYGGQFRKIELNPYFEVGVTNRTSLLVNAFVPMLRFRNQFGSFKSAGSGDVEVGVRQRLTPVSKRTAFSVQTMFLFPTYSENRNPAPGNHQWDVEPRLQLGRSHPLEKRSLFWDVEAAFRYRSGAPADQLRFDATVGSDLASRFMLMGQGFAIKGLRNGTPIQLLNNPNLQSDFDLYKAQVSTVFRISRAVRVQTGYFRAFAGRNTGAGQGFVVSLWTNF